MCHDQCHHRRRGSIGIIALCVLIAIILAISGYWLFIIQGHSVKSAESILREIGRRVLTDQRFGEEHIELRPYRFHNYFPGTLFSIDSFRPISRTNVDKAINELLIEQGEPIHSKISVRSEVDLSQLPTEYAKELLPTIKTGGEVEIDLDVTWRLWGQSDAGAFSKRVAQLLQQERDTVKSLRTDGIGVVLYFIEGKYSGTIRSISDGELKVGTAVNMKANAVHPGSTINSQWHGLGIIYGTVANVQALTAGGPGIVATIGSSKQPPGLSFTDPPPEE